jgi:hypothetical protein
MLWFPGRQLSWRAFSSSYLPYNCHSPDLSGEYKVDLTRHMIFPLAFGELASGRFPHWHVKQINEFLMAMQNMWWHFRFLFGQTVFIRPSLRRDVLWYTTVRLFHMSRSNLRTPWPIHFKFHRVIGIDGLMVCILYGEISNFHSRVVGLYSSNCRWFFVCRAVNWEPLGQFTSNFA